MPDPAREIAPTCNVRKTFRGTTCTGSSVITVLTGCVHEHVAERSVCQHHVEALANGRLYCHACLAVDGHTCEMALIREVARA
jgi:hypothetical protein